MESSGKETTITRYRAIQISGWSLKQFGLRNRMKFWWGQDIWFGNVPFCKVLLLANIIVWILVTR